MSSTKTFQVVLNNTKSQSFTVRIENFTHESFLRLLRISGFTNEISDDCFVDDIFYADYRDVNFNNINVLKVFTPSYDSSIRTPVKKEEEKKIPDAPRKRKLDVEEDDSDSNEVVEDGSDESHVEQLYCRECFGFDTTHENPILLCKNRKCSVACHKNCSKHNVFVCDDHDKKIRIRRRIF